MSLNWEWNDKMGTCKFADGTECNLYKGNAFMIAVHENEDNQTYSLVWFAVDENHMKNLLGLAQGFNNCFQSWKITEFTLNTKYKETEKFVQLAVKAKYEVTINLYN